MFFYGAFFVLCASNNDLKTVDAYFDFDAGKSLLNDKKVEKLKEYINVYHLHLMPENVECIKELLKPLATALSLLKAKLLGLAKSLEVN